jgi:hypothetical protein
MCLQFDVDYLSNTNSLTFPKKPVSIFEKDLRLDLNLGLHEPRIYYIYMRESTNVFLWFYV